MRVNIAIPEAHVSKPVLDAALEAVTRLNEQLIKAGAPTAEQLIERGGKWKPEPPGQEHFDHGGILAQRGHGDCDDWAPLHAASLRATGEDLGATAEVVRSGPHMWHAIVKRSNGKTDDPSKAAGMPSGGAASVHGAVLPLMHEASQQVVGGSFMLRPGLAVRPAPRGYQARVDVPWHWRQHLSDPLTPTDYAMTALHSSPTAPTALVGAIEGAIELAQAAGYADPDHLERLAAVSDACEGCPTHDLIAKYGHEHAAAAEALVGSFFGDAFKAITSPVRAVANFAKNPSLSSLTNIVTDPLSSAMRMAKPLASLAQPFAGAMRFIPGIGPVAASAVDLLAHPPGSFGDLAKFAMQQAPGFIPGLGPLAMMMPGGGGGGGGGQQMPQQMPQHYGQQMPEGYGQQMPQAYGYGPPQGYGGGFPQPWPRGFQ